MRKNLDQHVCVLTKRIDGKHFCQCGNLNSDVLFLKLNGRALV